MGEVYTKLDKKKYGAGICHLCGDKYFKCILCHCHKSEQHKKRIKLYFQFKREHPNKQFDYALVSLFPPTRQKRIDAYLLTNP